MGTYFSAVTSMRCVMLLLFWLSAKTSLSAMSPPENSVGEKIGEHLSSCTHSSIVFPTYIYTLNALFLLPTMKKQLLLPVSLGVISNIGIEYRATTQH